MKIGILTLPLHNNYGGILQNYALQQVLIRAGHEVETINQNNQKPIPKLRILLSYFKRKMIHFLFPKKVKLKTTKEEFAIINRETDRFINKYIQRTEIISRKKDFAKIAKEKGYNAYIVGSDQCWRPRYSIFLEMTFLEFVKKRFDIVRIAYAASFGTDQWEYNKDQASKCASLIKLFDLVTVREDSAVHLCKEHFDVEAHHVLDPTMLLSCDDYINLIEAEQTPQNEGSLFYYILDPMAEKKALIDHIANEQNLIPFTVMPRIQAQIRTTKDVKEHIEDCVYPPITRWLRGFMDAKMVVVDSFHGAVFSIIFNKPFWVISNAKRGNARFDSLLRLFHLEDRMLSIDNIESAITEWGNPIDWDRVNIIKEEEIKHSLDLLYLKLNN